jgi:hypothetical protein
VVLDYILEKGEEENGSFLHGTNKEYILKPNPVKLNITIKIIKLNFVVEFICNIYITNNKNI